MSSAINTKKSSRPISNQAALPQRQPKKVQQRREPEAEDEEYEDETAQIYPSKRNQKQTKKQVIDEEEEEYEEEQAPPPKRKPAKKVVKQPVEEEWEEEEEVVAPKRKLVRAPAPKVANGNRNPPIRQAPNGNRNEGPVNGNRNEGPVNGNRNDARQKREDGEFVRPFFQSIGLPQYAPLFASEGYDTLRNLFLATPENMKMIGVKHAHIQVIEEGIATKIVRAPSSNVLTWEIEDVTAWLERVNLSELNHVFVQNGFDGVMICTLTTEQMKEDLNITSLGLRKKLVLEIERLKKPEKIYLDLTPRGIASVSNYRKQPKRPFLNFSLAVQVKNPDVIKKVESVQEALKEFRFLANPRKYIPPENFHITLALFQIESQEKLTLAQKTLEEVKKNVFPHFYNNKANPKVHFNELNLFDNARVIWAEMVEDEDKKIFLEFAAAVVEEFQKAGFIKNPRNVQPHLTIMKQRQRLTNRRTVYAIERRLDSVDKDLGVEHFEFLELLANDQPLEEGGFEVYGRQYFTKEQNDEVNKKKRANYEKPVQEAPKE